MTPIAPHLTAFFQQRLPVERGVSQHTIESYAYSLKLLLEYASERLRIAPSKLELEQIDSILVSGFLGHLETQRGNSARTRNARLAAVKSFMRFVEHRVPAALEVVRRILAIPMKKTDGRLVKHLTLDEIRTVLNRPNLQTRLGLRDRAMLHLCFAGALRVSELVGLTLSDVTLGGQPSIRIHGKGRRERCLPLWKQVSADLRAWMAVRGEAPVPEVFLNRRDREMTRAGVAYLLKKYVRDAAKIRSSLDAKPFSPHVLRHSCALMILQATGDIRKVSLWLGHAHLQTTQCYLEVDPTEKLEAIEALTPPELRRGRFRPQDELIAFLTAR
ncbi:MAG: tyrosine-type recombinase/integrase [Candidatus Xenobia bacterium]